MGQGEWLLVLGRELAGARGGGVSGRLIWEQKTVCRGMASKAAPKKAQAPLRLTDQGCSPGF